MAEDIKEKIYKFLVESEKKFNLMQISQKLKISYPSVLKWVEVLKAERFRKPRVKVEDYGNIKLVGVE
jgi:Mn-dependent DtxR family transcriptional regulator